MGMRGGIGLLCCAWLACAQTPVTFPDVRLIRIASGFTAPTAITHAGDASGRLFIVEQRGQIWIVRNGARVERAFLDITSRVQCCGERGLLGLAFPPGFAAKQHFYVYYTDRAGDLIVARYRVSADPDAADPASGTNLLTIPHRQFGNHNGGQIAFGPDGYLYIGPGDGGGGGDTLRSGQNLNTLLGKILRIDVESGQSPYGIPPTNPFVGRGGALPEIWAYGLRNPWRFSFDRETGDLYIGDVGQNAWEEVDFQPASSRGGENYGWNIMEGNHCYPPGAGCSSSGLVLPVAEYSNPQLGCSVTGGYVYRGSRFPSMRGFYFYGDICSGRIWALKNDGAAWRNGQTSANLATSTFGEDEEGNVYIADYVRGSIHMLVAGAPAITSASVVNAASMAAGLVPGSIATAFGVGITLTGGIVQAAATPLPQELGGVSVTVNGIRAPLFAVAYLSGQEQINFQVPRELAGASRATVVVSNNGTQSAPVEVNVLAAQPGIFLLSGGAAAALDAQSRVVSASNPAERGGIVSLFVTGLGAVDNPPATGEAAPLTRLIRTLAEPLVTVDGERAEVLFSGLAPGLVGAYQVQIRVPAGLAAGTHEVTMALGGETSNRARLAVR